MLLQTERLTIRNFELKDAQDLFDLDSDPEVMRFIGGEPPASIENSIAGVERCHKYYEKYPGLGVFPAILNSTNEFIGWCALKYLDASDKIEVGYRLKKKFWNKGYATELTKALLKYAFEFLKQKEIHAVTHPENLASQRVLEKSGLKFVGNDNYYKMELKLYKIENPA